MAYASLGRATDKRQQVEHRAGDQRGFADHICAPQRLAQYGSSVCALIDAEEQPGDG